MALESLREYKIVCNKELKVLGLGKEDNRKPNNKDVKKISEIGKQINVECFMCKRVIKKMDANEELTGADEYHLCACIPGIAKLRGIMLDEWKDE